MNKKKLSNRQINNIKEAVKRGVPFGKLAAKYKRSEETIRYHAAKDRKPKTTKNSTDTVSVIPVKVYIEPSKFASFVGSMTTLGFNCSDIEFTENN